MELFPFSYDEFLQYNASQADEKSLSEYLRLGGVPDYVKNNMQQILISLVEDILIRDIAVRYGIRDVVALNQLLVYLMSNVGTPVSANKLTGMFGIKSSTTILDFFNYYSDSYLLDFVPQFSYSLKVQARNPKKIYAMDTGFVDAISIASTQNLCRKLENLIFLHLRRKYKNICYFKDKGECDFVTMERGRPTQVIQTYYEVTDENFDREINGLLEAMKTLGISEGWIVTMHQTDRFVMGDQTITMIPAHEFMMMKK
jgi:predicted AAA+ superfamily ATPase